MTRHYPAIPLSASQRFRDPIPVPGLTGYGVWTESVWDNNGTPQHGVDLTPVRAPWRELVTALDELGHTLPADPVGPVDEADAIVACCWRYGSYTHLLTLGELYPPLREDRSLSRIGDSEMRRINLEFSSGLAAWWMDRTRDPERVNRRVRAALANLPIPWRTKRTPWFEGYAEFRAGSAVDRLRQVEELSAATIQDRPRPVTSDAPEVICRQEANWIVLTGYRNGPIEELHAGHWNHATEIPGFYRLYADEVTRVGGVAAERIALHLMVRARHDVSPAVEIFASAGLFAGWSLTDETGIVSFAGLPHEGPIGPRLAFLADRYPTLFGTVRG